jgi:hypothetical protein
VCEQGARVSAEMRTGRRDIEHEQITDDADPQQPRCRDRPEPEGHEHHEESQHQDRIGFPPWQITGIDPHQSQNREPVAERPETEKPDGPALVQCPRRPQQHGHQHADGPGDSHEDELMVIELGGIEDVEPPHVTNGKKAPQRGKDLNGELALPGEAPRIISPERRFLESLI